MWGQGRVGTVVVGEADDARVVLGATPFEAEQQHGRGPQHRRARAELRHARGQQERSYGGPDAADRRRYPRPRGPYLGGEYLRRVHALQVGGRGYDEGEDREE